MFGFFRASKKIESAKALSEKKLIEDLRKSLADEGETQDITTLKSRLRIIDLEDKVCRLEKRIKRYGNTIATRKYHLKKKLISKKKVPSICVMPITKPKK
jgi:hypothetical protein